MARAFRDTGDERYALAFRTQLLRWIAQTDAPAVNRNGPGSAWRTIECGLRLLRSWQVAFDGFCKHLDDATLLLMIASMHRQAKQTKEKQIAYWRSAFLYIRILSSNVHKAPPRACVARLQDGLKRIASPFYNAFLFRSKNQVVTRFYPCRFKIYVFKRYPFAEESLGKPPRVAF